MNTLDKIIETVRGVAELALFVITKGYLGFAAVFVFATMSAALISLGGAFGLAAVYVLGTLAATLMMVQAGKLNKAVS